MRTQMFEVIRWTWLVAGLALACGPAEDEAKDAGKKRDAAVDAGDLADSTAGGDVLGDDAAGDDRDAGELDGALPPADASVDAGEITNTVVPFPELPCTVATLNGAPPPGEVRPGDDVVLDLQPVWGPTPVPPGVQVDLVRAPAGSRSYLVPAELEGRLAARLGFSYQTAYVPMPGALTPAPEPGVDLLGPYVVGLWDLPTPEQIKTCLLQVGTPHGLYLELFWDRSETDMDLQLAARNAQGQFCAVAGTFGEPIQLDGLAVLCEQDPITSTCYFGNCKSDAERPDFDGDLTHGSAGDPLLVRDEMRGFGAEPILIEAPAPGDYLVGTLFWRANVNPERALGATVRVHVQGQLRAQMHLSLMERSWGEAALIHWPEPGSDLCLDDLTTGVELCFPLGAEGCAGAAGCGPGTRCDPDLDQCLPDDPTCPNDGACGAQQLCHQATDVCAEPGCLVDPGCGEEGATCTPLTQMCVAPLILCEEADEPNNILTQATPVSGQTYEGTMCPGDVDVLELHGHAATRLEVLYQATAFEATLQAALLDASGDVISQGLAYNGEQGRLIIQVQEDGPLYLQLSDNWGARQQYVYTVALAELEPLACFDEPGEPNQTLEQAGNSVLSAGLHALTLCGPDDVDCHLLSVPARARGVLVVAFEDERGTVDLFDAATLLPIYASCSMTYGSAQCAWTNELDEEALYILQLGTWAPDAEAIPYSVLFSVQELPACEDLNEPNDAAADATALGAGYYRAGLCSPEDHDLYRVWLPAGGAVEALVSYGEGCELGAALTLEDGRPVVGYTGYGGVARVSTVGLPAGFYLLDVEARYPVDVAAGPYSLYLSGDLAPLPWPLDAGVAEAGAEDGPAADAGAEDAAAQEDGASQDAG